MAIWHIAMAWCTNMLGGANTSPLPDTYMLPGISKWQVEITIRQVVLGRAKGTFWAAARYQDWEESGEASSSVFHHNHPHKHDHHHGHHHYHRQARVWTRKPWGANIAADTRSRWIFHHHHHHHPTEEPSTHGICQKFYTPRFSGLKFYTA